MNRIILLPLLLLLTTGFGFKEPVLQVSKTTSDKQIESLERRIFKRYGLKVDVNVISRNEKNEITNLEFIRYQKDGKRGGGCSSDKFGILIITQHGCRIADLGYEANVVLAGN